MNNIQQIEKNNIELEENILACLINGSELYEEFNEDFFSQQKAKNIRRAITSLLKNEIEINHSTVTSLLIQKTNNKNWPKEIDRITKDVDKDSIKVLNDKLNKNKLCIEAIKAANNIIVSVNNDDSDSLQQALSNLNNIDITKKKESFSIHESMLSSLGMIEDSLNSGTPHYYKTNISDLDDAFGGYFPNDLIVVAGRPSMGKTTVATFLTYKADCPVGFISSEMNKEELSNKLLSADSGVSVEKMRRTDLLKAEDIDSIKNSIERLSKKELYVNEKGDITILEIEKQVKEWVEKHNTKVIFVDYIQRIKHENKSLNNVDRIGDIANRLKNIAKRYGITVIALAQINREGEKNVGGMPKMSDIKGCGDIEQEADIVIILHRNSYQTSASNEESQINFIFGKNRQGKIGIVNMFFVPSTCSYKTFKDPYMANQDESIYDSDDIPFSEEDNLFDGKPLDF